MPGCSLDDQVKCLEREVRMREVYYPKRVEAGRMTTAAMVWEIETMKAALATVKWARDRLDAREPL